MTSTPSVDSRSPLRRRPIRRQEKKRQEHDSLRYFVVVLSGVLITVMAASVAFFLWPRDPTWHLNDISVDHDAFQNLIAVITGQGKSSEPVNVTATLEVINPNYVGVLSTSSTVWIALSGEEDALTADSRPRHVRCGCVQQDSIARGASENVYVPPRHTLEVDTKVSVLVGRAFLGQKLMEAVSQGDGLLALDAHAYSDARVWWMTFRFSLLCHLKVDVHHTLDASRAIAEKTCDYSYAAA